MAVTPARLNVLRLNAGRLNYVAATVPTNPTPPDGSLAGPLALQWTAAPASYDVYFGTTLDPPLVGTTNSPAWIAPPLTEGVVYYWKVVATNALGPPATGPVWSFTAATPVAPTNPSPPHHSTGQPTTLTLAWTQPLTVPGDIVFDVYFGPTPTMARVSVGQSATTYTPGTLHDGADYYWRIVARNNVGETSGPTWTFETRNPTQGLITIEGVDVRGRVRRADLSIRDLLTDTPNTCTFTIDGSAPTVAQEVRIALATMTPTDVIYGGIIDTVESVYEGVPANRAWRVTCQDYVYAMNRRKVRIRYGQQSATAIAEDLRARYAPTGFTGNGIQQGLPVVTGGIDFTEEDLTACYARLAQRIGGYWYVDYERDVHMFLVEAIDAPQVITKDARVLLDDPPIDWQADLTQIRTRVYVEGGGSQARAVISPGATVLPVTDGSWYAPSGGLVVSGPQRIRYTGKGTVGGPAAPIVSAQLVAGAAGPGPYSYVVTQIVTGVESPLSAPSSPPVTIPPVSAPSTPVTVAPVSSVVPTPASSVAAAPVVTQVANPQLEMLDELAVGTLTPHCHYFWRYVYLTATGQSAPSPPNQFYVPFDPNNPSNPIYGTNLSRLTTSPDPRVIARRLYRTRGIPYQPPGTIPPTPPDNAFFLEATINDNTTTTYTSTKPDNALGAALTSGNTTGSGALVPGAFYSWLVTFGTASGETTPGPAGPAPMPPGNIQLPAGCDTVNLSAIPISNDARVTKRRIYRTTASGGTYRLEATINDNTTTTYTSSKGDGQLGVEPPTVNTTGGGGLIPGSSYWWTVTFVTATGESLALAAANLVIPANYDAAQLSNVPVSADGRVTKRRIYRTIANGGTYRFEAELADNVTTTYASTKTDAQLGADLVNTNTTSATGKIQVTTIAIGPAGTTARKLYRTESGGASYKFVVTLEDNTTTTYLDNKSDAQLGAPAAGNEVIQLTGIPASGDGAVLYEVRPGDDVNLMVQCDDTAAQAALAALEGPPSLGIIEHYLQDRRLSLSAATATGNADLKLFSHPLVTVHYATRDPKTRSGKTVTFNLPELSLVGDFTIQTVAIDQIDQAPGLFPRYTVTASSVRFSMEDVFRRLQLETL